MIVLAWIGQIILFFVLWRLLHWVTCNTRKRAMTTSLWVELCVNLVVALVLLIVIDNLHSAWWLMGIIGAAIGVITGHAAARSARDG